MGDLTNGFLPLECSDTVGRIAIDQLNQSCGFRLLHNRSERSAIFVLQQINHESIQLVVFDVIVVQ